MHLAHLNETSEAFRNMSSENELKPPSKCYSMRQFMEAQWIDSMSISFDGICYKDHPLNLIFFSGPLHWSLLKQEKYCTNFIYSSKFSRPRESVAESSLHSRQKFSKPFRAFRFLYRFSKQSRCFPNRLSYRPKKHLESFMPF